MNFLAPLPPIGSDPRNSVTLSDRAREAALALEAAWAHGEPSRSSIEGLWSSHAPDGAIEVLSALIKVDLRCRFERGDRPDVASYLERFAPLREARDRVVSLVYEEYCLREERGERPDPDSFAARYDPWRDSLLSQLRYHRMLSQAVGAVARKVRLPEPGERFRTFRLRSVLGRGGSACVFLANDEALGDREVALKLSSERGTEAAIQGRLDHAHIVPILSVTDDPETGLRGLCMPFRAGLSLDEVIRRIDPASRPRSAAAIRDLVVDPSRPREVGNPRWQGFPERGTYAEAIAWLVSIIARALAYAHSQGVLHRDVKPANVLLTDREGPQLLDFNLAHDPNAADRAEAALRGGTLPYMAPEQLRAFVDPDHWSRVGAPADVYSTGLLLRELLTGRRPSLPDAGLPLTRAIQDLLDRRACEFGPVRSLNPDVPHALEAILGRCLAVRPEDRYATATALAEDLECFVARGGLVHAANPSRRERFHNWRRGRSVRLSLIGTAAASLVAVVGLTLPALFTPVGVKDQVAAALASIKVGDFTEAEGRIAEALEREPDSLEARAARVELLSRSGKFAEAVKQIDSDLMLARRPDLKMTKAEIGLLYHRKGENLQRAGRIDEAIKAFEVAIQTKPQIIIAYEALAKIAESLERFDESKKRFDQAIDQAEKLGMDSDNPQLLARLVRQRAVVEWNLGDSARRGGGKKPDMTRSRPHFLAAEADLKRARKLVRNANEGVMNTLDWTEALVRVSLGDMAADEEDPKTAVAHYSVGVRLLDALRSRGFTLDKFKALREAAERRLQLESEAIKHLSLRDREL